MPNPYTPDQILFFTAMILDAMLTWTKDNVTIHAGRAMRTLIDGYSIPQMVVVSIMEAIRMEGGLVLHTDGTVVLTAKGIKAAEESRSMLDDIEQKAIASLPAQESEPFDSGGGFMGFRPPSR